MKPYALFAAVVFVMVAPRTAARADTLGELHFPFDSSALPVYASDELARTVAVASEHPEMRVVLDAHCDPVGTAPYNVGLAIRRAESVRGRLIALGLPADQIVFAVYGKAGADRPTFADDRRVTVWATREPLADVIDRTLDARGTAVTWNEPLTTAQIDAAPEPVAFR
jgi:hypothetical protein